MTSVELVSTARVDRTQWETVVARHVLGVYPDYPSGSGGGGQAECLRAADRP